ncbi:MAG: hypothetical protein AB1668_00030 [Nanoarchaeota archaeon]
MAKRKHSRKAGKKSKKSVRKGAAKSARKKGRSPSGKGKHSKVRKLIRLAKAGKLAGKSKPKKKKRR